jgi:CheY-like chemotaxis protein
MSDVPFQLVHVDDEKATLEQVKLLLEGDEEISSLGGVSVTSCESFSEALDHLDHTFTDIVILDVMKDHGLAPEEPELAGREAFEQLRAKVFVPVIFYTGFAHHVQDLEEDLKLLRVVEKGNAQRLIDAVREVIGEGLPSLNRGLVETLRKVQRDYMWDFVAPHWPELQSQADTVALAHMLIRRLALTLESDAASSLVPALPGAAATDAQVSGIGKVHPVSMYVMPPIPGATPMAGDVRRGEVGGTAGHWIVLTPSCDFANGKADTVLIAACEPLAAQPELDDFLADTTVKGRRKRLEKLMGNRSNERQADRYHFLPGVLEFPDLLVDLRALETVPREDFDALEPVVSLDAPFAEALLAQFARFVGRLGTPDPDFGLVVQRLQGHPDDDDN